MGVRYRKKQKEVGWNESKASKTSREFSRLLTAKKTFKKKASLSMNRRVTRPAEINNRVTKA